MNCSTTIRAAVAALVLGGSSGLCQAGMLDVPQRGKLTPATPQLLIASPFDGRLARELRVEVAGAIRNQLQREHSAGELFITTERNVQSALTASAEQYPDSTLNDSDLIELAKIVHADFVLRGSVDTARGRLLITARILIRVGVETLTDPMPPTSGRSVAEIAKAVAANVPSAIAIVPRFRECISALRAQDPRSALRIALTMRQQHPTSRLTLRCALDAYDLLGRADSLVSIGTQLLSRDSANVRAAHALAYAYDALNHPRAAAAARLAFWRAALINSSRFRYPDARTPTVADTLRMNWLYGTGTEPKTLAMGERLLAIDPASATPEFYRQLLEMVPLGDSAGAERRASLANEAARRFPKDSDLQARAREANANLRLRVPRRPPVLLLPIETMGSRSQQSPLARISPNYRLTVALPDEKITASHRGVAPP